MAIAVSDLIVSLFVHISIPVFAYKANVCLRCVQMLTDFHCLVFISLILVDEVHWTCTACYIKYMLPFVSDP